MTRRGEELIELAVVEGVARIATGLEDPWSYNPPVLAGHVRDAVRLVGLRLQLRRDGALLCPFCGPRRGSFTPRGLYLHLTRHHRPEILDLVQLEVARIVRSSKALGPSTP